MIRAAAVGATLVVAAGGIALASGDDPAPAPEPAREAALSPPAKKRDRLTSFAGCSALTRYARSRADALIRSGDYGGYPVTLTGTPVFRTAPPATGAPEAQPAPAAAAPVADGSTALPGDTSGTNVQEQGVGEPDIAVTDGTHVYTVVDGTLRAVLVRDGARVAGSLRLDDAYGASVLRIGNRLLVVSTVYEAPVVMPVPGGAPEPAVPVAPSPPVADAPVSDRSAAIAPAGPPSVVVRLVDIRDAGAMRVLSTMRLEGSFVGAREVDGVVRLVVSTAPNPIPMVFPGSVEAPTETAAIAQNRVAAAAAPAGTWLPNMRITRAGRATVSSRAVRCRDVRRPTQFSGLGTLSVLTIDPARGLEPVDRDAVMTDGDIVYGSRESLYVTTPRWMAPDATEDDVPPGTSTQIHRFGTAERAATVYRSSGRVPGFLLNQFALSEHEGHLRVASTSEPTWTGDAEADASESAVTVLRERDGRLVRVGQVTGLGRTETIHAVRFLGDTGYVVTFRRTDPLYVVDLREPTRPVVRGELKVPGYSAYLHPVDEGLLLGVGQDADADGRVRGTQLSLFDVSDPTRPRRLDQATHPGGWSEVEGDHHAFLWWAPERLAVVPVESYGSGSAGSQAIGVRVTREDGIRQAGAAQHPRDEYGNRPQIRRTMVVGGRVVTVSAAGVGIHDPSDLRTRGFVRLG